MICCVLRNKLGCFHVFCLFLHFIQTHYTNEDCGYHSGMFFHVCLFQIATLFLVRGFLGTPVSDKYNLGRLPLYALPHLCQNISYQNGVSNWGSDRPNTRQFSGLSETMVFFPYTRLCKHCVGAAGVAQEREWWLEKTAGQRTGNMD